MPVLKPGPPDGGTKQSESPKDDKKGKKKKDKKDK
jgi:hypothetical protein